MRLFDRKISAGITLLLCVAVALVAGFASVWLFGDSKDTDDGRTGSITSADADQPVELAVQSVVNAYNAGDWEAVKQGSCGDVAARTLEESRGGLATNRADDEVRIIGLDDFEFTTVDSAMNAYTFARVTIGRPDDPAGDGDAVAFFALLDSGDGWKVCTSQIVSTTGI
ncbi:hypothetical protein [Rhodococcus qingshengii]|uniref:hypothetical protein n=1 Tax=Rhodococcus qingshengii TaxID=334542 RepID=UPI00237D019C|nr:hypothetical protein [Rhodococcus qingshengii]WCT06224.1 hypothetical protein PI247_31955 [Rhodococcus qingshengii]